MVLNTVYCEPEQHKAYCELHFSVNIEAFVMPFSFFLFFFDTVSMHGLPVKIMLKSQVGMKLYCYGPHYSMCKFCS